MTFIEFLSQPMPWYVAGPLIGLVVPILLIVGNKSFGISSSFRHICAYCIPGNIPFFQYDWRKEIWNLSLVAGIVIGGLIADHLLPNPKPLDISPKVVAEMRNYNIQDTTHIIPTDLFNFSNLLSLKGFLIMVVGGFLVGFGTRYAGGCTSGHSIMGVSTLQWPSLIATICFMIGGFIMVNFILPYILAL
jgi:uncharacterized membrane protein YedE/YeeE